MTTEKISVTSPDAVVGEARRIARERAVPLSACLTRAAQGADRGAESLAIRAEIGESTPTETARSDAEDKACFLNAERTARE